MGFFDKLKYSSIYEKRLKFLQVNPRELPADFHVKLCTACHADAAYYTNNVATYGADAQNLANQCFIDLADVVALCLLGPQVFDMRARYSHKVIIEDLVGFWVRSGPESDTRLLAMHGVNNLRKMNREFADAFITERIKEESRK